MAARVGAAVSSSGADVGGLLAAATRTKQSQLRLVVHEEKGPHGNGAQQEGGNDRSTKDG
jgi:hypothetical protein